MATSKTSASIPGANVVRIDGKAYVRDALGQLIALKPGDLIEAGQELTIDAKGQLQLKLADGQLIDIGGGRQVLANEEFLSQSGTDRSEAAIKAPAASEADAVLAALNAGQDPFAILDPAAAGLTAGGAEGGHGFVRLLRVSEAVSPLAFEFTGGRAAEELVVPTGNVETPAEESAGETPPPSSGLPSLSVGNIAVTEGENAIFTVSLSSPSTSPVSFIPTLSSGSASVGSDTATLLEYFDGSSWQAVGTSGVTLPAGATSLQIRVATIDDPSLEGNETFSLDLAVTSGNTSNTGASATATLSDDVGPGLPGTPDSADTTQLSLSASSSVAEGDNITYTATLSNPAGTPVTITLSNGATINIPAGQVSGSVTVAAPGEDPYIDAGTVSATISSTSGGSFENLVVSSTPASTTVSDTLTPTSLALSASTAVAEGGSIVYTATLSNPAGTAMTVTLSNGATINIAAGQTSGSVSVTAPSDDVYLDAGSVSATIAGTSGGNFEQLNVSGAAAVTTINDTLDLTTLSITGAASVTEGASAAYSVSLTSPAQTAVTVTLSYSGTAANGADFTGSTTLIIPAGSSSANFSIAALDDNFVEGAENFTVNLVSASGGNFENLAVSGSAASVTTTIVDNDTAPTVSINDVTVNEDAGTVSFTVSLDHATTAPVSFNFATSNGSGAGSATAGLDYTALSGTGSIAAGATTATITIAITDDFIREGNETFNVTLSNLSANVAATGNDLVGVGTITDAGSTTPPVPEVITSADTVYARIVNVTASTAEGGNLVHRVELVDAAGNPVTVPTGGSITVALSYSADATLAADYQAARAASVTIGAGQSSALVTNATFNDTIFEGNESYTLSVSGITDTNSVFEAVALNGSQTSVGGTIVDNDSAPTIASITSPSATEGSNLVYTVTLSNPSSTATSFPFSLGGGSAAAGDYGSPSFSNGVSLAGGVLSIPANVSSFSVTLPTVQDVLDEADETVPLNIGGVTGIGTIIDNDAAPSLSVNDVTVNEAAGAMSFTVSLSAVSGQTVTVNYASSNGSATAGSDYSAVSGSLSFAPGETSKTIVVPITDDSLTEASETLNITLSGASNATIADASGLGTITDNDAVPVNSVPAAQSTAEDTARVFSSANGNAITVSDVDGGTLTTTVSVTNGTLTALNFAGATITSNGTASVTISGTAAAINGALNGLSYAPSADYNGNATLTVLTSDGVRSDTDTIAITVTPVADIVADAVTTAEDTAISFNAITGSNGASADSFESAGRVVSGVTQGANGTVSFAADGTLTYTPNANFNGTDSFSYTVTSGGVTETATVNVTVTASNDAPSAAGGALTGTEDTPLTLAWSDFGVSDIDSASSSLSITITSLPADGKLQVFNGAAWVDAALNQSLSKASIDAGNLRFVPDSHESGIDGFASSGTGNLRNDYASFGFVASDGSASSPAASLRIDITPVADAPTISLTAGTAVSHTQLSVDGGTSGGGLTLIDGVIQVGANQRLWQAADFAAAGGNANGSLTQGDIFVYTQTTNVNSANGNGSQATDARDYIVLEKPRSAYTITSSSDHVGAYNGYDNVQITDNATGKTWGVTNNIEDIIFGDGTTYSGNAVTVSTYDTIPLNIANALVDADNSETLSGVTLTGIPAGVTLSAGTLQANGSWLLSQAQLGGLTMDVPANTGAFTIVASVTSTESANGSAASNTATLQIAAINHAPVGVADSAVAVEAGGMANGTAGTNPTGNVLTNDTDADTGDSKSVSAISGGTVGGSTAGSYGTLTLNANGSYTYTVDNSLAAVQALRTSGNTLTDSFTYTVRDAAGASSTATLTVTVQGANDAPVGVNDSNAVTENATVTASAATGVLTNDTDVDAGDSKVVSAVSGLAAGTVGGSTAGTYGTLTLNADGSYSYIANTAAAEALRGAQVVTDSFTYTVRDTAGATSTATLNIVVTGVNDAPTTNNITASGNEDTLITVTLAGADVDGTVVGYLISTLPGNGTLYSDAAGTQAITAGSLVSGPVYFRPDTNWNGSSSFQYAARDNDGATDATPATATITVVPVNDGTPAAVADNFVAIQGQAITITAAQLMANDSLFDRAQITSSTTLSGLVNNGDGTWTYTPPAGSAGTTPSFSYTLTDDQGETSSATVSISVYATRDDIITVNESALANGSGGGVSVVSGNLLSNDPGGATTISSVGGVTDGSANDTDARSGYIGVNHVVGGVTVGNVVVDVNAADGGLGNFTYTLTDNANHSAAANNNSLTSPIAYVTTGGSGTGANLQVNIVDDRPQAFTRTVQVTEAVMPSYRLMLVLDNSRSMTLPEAGGTIQNENENGSVSITTRLELAKQAMKDLVSQYFDQASTVTVQLVTFAPSGVLVNFGGATTFTSKAAALAAIDSIAVSDTGGTNYEAGLTTALSALDANNNGVLDNTSGQTISYFISDGAPTAGNTTTAANNWNTFATNNGIQSYAIGIGTGITASTALNTIHNVDADASGTRDTAVIVPDLNDLSATLTNSVPVSYGGNVVGGGSSSVGSALGADGGFIQTLVVPLDTDGNAATAPVNVTFTFNGSQISWSGGFPAGSPITGDTLTLGSGNGFALGTLNFNFATGDYTYYAGGSATEGTTFAISFIARDGDGDVTPSTTLNFEVIDGQPIARPDFDSLTPNGSSFTGNVITGLGTDSGLAENTLVTDFTARGAGADTAADGATVSSIVFQGQTFNLAAASSGTALGGSYTVSAAGTLTWTHASNGSSLTFNNEGYYSYTPPTANIPNPPVATATTVNLNAAPGAATGLTLSGRDENGNTTAVTHYDPANTANDGVGVTGQGVASSAMAADVGTNPNRYLDGLETMIFTFNTSTHPRGVENISFTINADNSNLGSRIGVGGSSSLSYNVYHIDGHLLGSFVSTAEGTVTLPAQYSNVGWIEVQAASDTYARISGVSFTSILADTSTTVIAPVEIGYTLTDADGDTSSSTLTLSSYNNAVSGDAGNNTLTGSAINDQLFGQDGNDTLSGGAGHDLLSGGNGADILNGEAGNDQLFGGAGNDTLSGGDGNDRLTGGGGNDSLTGGAGSDVFVWSLADRGAVGSPAIDTILSYDNATAASGGDVLDLRDLLQGEYHSGTDAGSLGNYLHFTSAGGNTTIQISSGGAFSNGFSAAAVDQQIVLTGVDLTSGGTLNDQAIIQDLLSKGKLQTD